jgi:hypothetical protein
MSYDKNEYLRNQLKIPECKQKDFNSLASEVKNSIIDSLVKRVKEKNDTVGFIGLVLIFEATIKNIVKTFYAMFKRYGYDYPDFMSIIITEFYILTKEVFKQKSEEGFRANYNYFINIKLRSNIIKILNREKSKQKLQQKFVPVAYQEDNEENIDQKSFNGVSVLRLKEQMYTYYIEILCKDTKKLNIYFNKFEADITNKEIAGQYDLSKAQISKIIKEVNEDIKVLLKDKKWNLFI